MPEISLTAIFSAIVPIIVTIALGWFFRAKDWVDQRVQTGMMRLVIWIFTPCLVVNRVLGNKLLADFSTVWKSCLAGFLTVSVGIAVAVFLARFFGISESSRRRAFGYCCGVSNYGYFAIPICMSLCPPDTLGVMLLFNSSIDVAVWSVGLAVLNGKISPVELLKSVVNPIFFAMIFSLVCNFAGAAPHVPAWVFGTTQSLGACMVPCGTLLIGMSLPVLLNGFRVRDDPLVSAGALSVRLLIVPALILAAALIVPALPQDLRFVLIIQAGMPAAMLSIVVLQLYNNDARLALRIALSTSVVCVLTLPFWIKIGFRLLTVFH